MESAKLRRERADKTALTTDIFERRESTVDVPPVTALNDWVVINRHRRTGNIVGVGDADWLDLGTVLSAGFGLPGANGVRCPSQVRPGDVVQFASQHIVQGALPADVFGESVVVVSERSLFCIRHDLCKPDAPKASK